MSLYPLPCGVQLLIQLIQGLPQLHILDRLLVGSTPAVTKPAADPLGQEDILEGKIKKASLATIKMNRSVKIYFTLPPSQCSILAF